MNKKKLVVATTAAITAALLFSGCGKIPSGYTGVKVVDGIVQQETLPTGRYGVTGPRTNIIKVDNRRQTKTYSGRVFGESSSQVVVYAEGINLTYQISPEASIWLVSNVGDDFEKEIIPAAKVASAIKNALANMEIQYCTNRSYIEPAAKAELQKTFDEYYYPGAIVVHDVSISQMDFEDSYNDQIAKISNLRKQAEADAIANQMKIDAAKAEAEAEATKAEAAKKTAEANAEVTRIEAESYAEVMKIKAAADAEQIKMIIQNLTPEYIEYLKVLGWNGQLPKVVTEGSGMILMNPSDGEE